MVCRVILMIDMCTVSHCASFSVATVNVFIRDQYDANVTGWMFFRNCLECWVLHEVCITQVWGMDIFWAKTFHKVVYQRVLLSRNIILPVNLPWKNYNKSSAVAEMGDVATIDMGQKEGGGCCGPYAGAWTLLVQCGLGQGLFPYQVASSSSHPATIDMGQKLGWGGCAFFYG